jgi:molybdopterin-guanine dinucleotide biosynthesis protein A
LAGGEGVRIGGSKPLRLLGDSSLIERALALSNLWSKDVIVVGRTQAQVGSANSPFLRDAPGLEGPIAGLAAGLRYAKDRRHGALLAIPCDSPFLPTDLFERLFSALAPEVGAALATSGGVLHPTCALWRVRCFSSLGPYLVTGRRSLRGFAEYVKFATANWPLQPADPFFNINSNDDLAEAEALIAD